MSPWITSVGQVIERNVCSYSAGLPIMAVRTSGGGEHIRIIGESYLVALAAD
jgi:hypothetical protein